MTYRERQLELLRQIEEEGQKEKPGYSTVSSVADFANDPRLCLTAVFFPPTTVRAELTEKLIKPLRTADDRQYCCTSGITASVTSRNRHCAAVRNTLSRSRRWRRWGGWPGELPTISTIS